MWNDSGLFSSVEGWLCLQTQAASWNSMSFRGSRCEGGEGGFKLVRPPCSRGSERGSYEGRRTAVGRRCLAIRPRTPASNPQLIRRPPAAHARHCSSISRSSGTVLKVANNIYHTNYTLLLLLAENTAASLDLKRRPFLSLSPRSPVCLWWRPPLSEY